MCGRFTLKTNASEWVQQLFEGLRLLDVPENPPRYNIAPTQPILCVLQSTSDAPFQVRFMRWGLVPFWSDDLAIGNRMINARCETLAEKPSFRKPFAKQRCLVVADGYYEWKSLDKKNKVPFWIHPRIGGAFAMAGLWDCNRKIDPKQELYSTTIITTSANETTRDIHDRMPVFLKPAQFADWLNPDIDGESKLSEWLRPASNDLLEAMMVSSHVNNPRHEDASCLTSVVA